MTATSSSTANPLAAFASVPDGAVDVFNQRRFHSQASYTVDADQVLCSGRQAFVRYAELLTPLLAKFGGCLRIWQGRVHAELTRSNETWDVMMAARCPNAAAVAGLLSDWTSPGEEDSVNRRAGLTKVGRPRLTNRNHRIRLKLVIYSGNPPGPRWTPVSAEIWSMVDAC